MPNVGMFTKPALSVTWAAGRPSIVTRAMPFGTRVAGASPNEQESIAPATTHCPMVLLEPRLPLRPLGRALQGLARSRHEADDVAVLVLPAAGRRQQVGVEELAVEVVDADVVAVGAGAGAVGELDQRVVA